MRLLTRGLAILIGFAVLAGLVFVVCARFGLLTQSEAALRAKYMLPTSKIIDIDGEPIHYSDEGSGDPIVLIHGSLGSLLMWNDWVKVLTPHYRVIRFDRPPAGLSGPDPKNRYDAEREVAVIEGLTARLGVNRYFLVATSSGGISGLALAAKHPEQIRGLVLSNIAVKPVAPDPYRYPWMLREMRAIDPIFKIWRSKTEWRLVLESNMVNHSKITDALVTQWADLNNRPATFAAAAQPRSPVSPFARAAGDLAKITAPTLLLWSENDTEMPLHPITDDALAMLAVQDKTVAVIPHCEHMMPLDCGPQSAALALPFFDRVAAAGP